MAGMAPINVVTEADTLPLEEQIRARAYEIYLERGEREGSALDDWLEAEAEVLQEHRGPILSDVIQEEDEPEEKEE